MNEAHGNGPAEESRSGAVEAGMGNGMGEPPTAELGASVAGGPQSLHASASPSLAAGTTDGHGPDGAFGAADPYRPEAPWWQRPEAALGAAFVGGLILAVLLKRGRS